MTITQAVQLVSQHENIDARAQALNSALRQVDKANPSRTDLAWNVNLIIALRRSGHWPPPYEPAPTKA